MFMNLFKVARGGACVLMIAAVTVISDSYAEAGTNGDKEALAAAKQYLSFEAFSLKGLIAQLDSPDGGQFTVAQANYGVAHTSANWDKEAFAAAKEYLSTQAFSLNALIAQLDSPYGSQFTVAQATYGARRAL
jgi:hypothetical protein